MLSAKSKPVPSPVPFDRFSGGRSKRQAEPGTATRDALVPFRPVGTLVPTSDALPVRVAPPDEFSHLYASIERLFGDQQEAVVGVTSAVAAEGKTTVAINLAAAAAQGSYKRVCLVDLSLGPDVLRQRLGLPYVPPLEPETAGCIPEPVTVSLGDGVEFVVFPSGPAPQNAARTARSPGIPEFLARLRELFDVVIVDLPAVATDNVLPIAEELDGVMMVMQAGVTPAPVIRSAIDRLPPGKVLGVVLNQRKLR